MKRAVFIDKDGTLIKDVPYNVDPSLITLENGVEEGLALLAEEDFLFVIISNQSGVALGYFEESSLKPVSEKIELLVASTGIKISRFYYCPHHPEGVLPKYAIVCNCRKPKPGLLLQASEDLDIDLEQSWMIGDILNDIEAGNEAGCKTILIDNGGETEWILDENRTPLFTVNDFKEAAETIISHLAQAPNISTHAAME